MNRRPVVVPLFAIAVLLLVAVQGELAAQQDFKQRQLSVIDGRLARTSDPAESAELNAQKSWLSSWQPGKMPSKAIANENLPARRTEPALQSANLARLKQRVASPPLDEDLHLISQFAQEHPDDAAILQYYLHTLDNAPASRKKHLDDIENLSVALIELLQETSDTQTRESKTERILARQFTRYRRARALAYRELPDVVEARPIEDQQKLNKLIRQAHEDLVEDAGSGRTEFVLLEIRMLRRSGQHGLALQMLEKFGASILPKWYLKKRRDLLGELDWEPAHLEAAEIYAAEFPEEVAKEAASNE
ncbi:hypothetical protein [Mariniblastus fucicola]|uniref:Uncharacterized protein n=1 Tax=Mariniblastus fucicola TaxID=980251 RepID=A0A5B9P8E3_9BACT|nr:hypothetical protein [Mariniblastus fucicola]QEG22624.1 hypothetical protein MFFC18_25070 [Mariniblastus fucicola]